MTGQFHIGHIDATIRSTIIEDGAVVDLSGAAVITLKLKKPDGTYVSKPGAFVTNGSDGRVQYVTTSAAELDQEGPWSAQWYLEMGLFKGHTDDFSFDVAANIP